MRESINFGTGMTEMVETGCWYVSRPKQLKECIMVKGSVFAIGLIDKVIINVLIRALIAMRKEVAD